MLAEAMGIAAGVLLLIGASIAVFNFGLTFLPQSVLTWLLATAAGPPDATVPPASDRPSGIPQLGALCSLGAWSLLPSDSVWRVVALAAAVLDTGSLHWFPIAALWHLLRTPRNAQRDADRDPTSEHDETSAPESKS